MTRKIDPRKFSGLIAKQPLPTHADVFGQTVVFFYDEDESGGGRNDFRDNGFIRFNQDGWVKVLYVNSIEPKTECFVRLANGDEFLTTLIENSVKS